MAMNGTDSGKTYIKLPDSFGSERQLYKAIQQLQVRTEGATIIETADSTIRLITHRPKARLHITYTLQQDWSGPLHHPKNFRAILYKKYINATGFALFILPKMDSTQKVDVALDWSRMPAGWAIGNSLHAQTNTYKGRLRLDDFQNTFYTAGDFRITKHLVAGKPIYIALRDTAWKFSDETLNQQIITIISKEREFWNDHTEPYYFVNLISFDGEGSYNGSALHQSFTLAISKDFNLGTPLLRLLAHEYMHRWNGIQIRLSGHEQENAWMGEGFTDYYTYKLLYRSGLITLDQYVASINKVIAEYYLSPVRNESKNKLGELYWTSREYNDLPYRKGAVYALYLDQYIHTQSKGKYSLDDVMFSLLKASKNKQPVTESLFLQLVKGYSNSDIYDQHMNMIDKGLLIPVMSVSAGPSLAAQTMMMGKFELGFDLSTSWKNKKITGLKEGSNAWTAGLRNGQSIVGYSINFDDFSQPSAIDIMEDGIKKTINYVPMSAEKMEVPQLVITK
jgi:predicted metalloprotease with PDZ domain